MKVFLNVYGVNFQLQGNAEQAIEHLCDDFRFFVSTDTPKPDVVVNIVEQEPPYDSVPQSAASAYTPRNICITEEDVTYLDYSTKALGVWERSKNTFTLYSEHFDYQYEAVYLFLISRIGELLDAKRLHRIHAMAISFNGKSVLAILPMGGGKSTLCNGLLRVPDFNFLSDDSPLIDREGKILAYPLRLGLLPGNEVGIPEKHIRRINRMEFGPKVLLNYEYFAHKVVPSSDPGIVFIGERSLAKGCRIEKIGWLDQHKSIVADCVVGLGLYQGLEFVLRTNVFELFAKAGTAISRFRNARRLFRNSEVYRLVLGRDTDANVTAVAAFVREKLGPR
ncbi:hypothetical protein N9181_01355 [bacterium]|nr:hypothetical protein [bacterium]